MNDLGGEIARYDTNGAGQVNWHEPSLGQWVKATVERIRAALVGFVGGRL